jgi:hypothetical protein
MHVLGALQGNIARWSTKPAEQAQNRFGHPLHLCTFLIMGTAFFEQKWQDDDVGFLPFRLTSMLETARLGTAGRSAVVVTMGSLIFLES